MIKVEPLRPVKAKKKKPAPGYTQRSTSVKKSGHNPFEHMHLHDCSTPNCQFKMRGFSCLNKGCKTHKTAKCPSCRELQENRYYRSQRRG